MALGPQPTGGGGALNCSLCLDPSPALTLCASLAEGTPAEMPWRGWPRAGLRLTPSSAPPPPPRAQGRRGESPSPVETGCVDSLPAFVLSPHCPSLHPAHLSCVLKLGNGRGGGGGQSPRLPGLTGTAFRALVVSLLLGESRLHGFTKGLWEAGHSCTPAPAAALQQEGLGSTGGFLPGGDSASWETWVEPRAPASCGKAPAVPPAPRGQRARLTSRHGAGHVPLDLGQRWRDQGRACTAAPPTSRQPAAFSEWSEAFSLLSAAGPEAFSLLTTVGPGWARQPVGWKLLVYHPPGPSTWPRARARPRVDSLHLPGP